MQSLINRNFNRTYNPSGEQNALSDIKRLLTSRDTVAQNKACGYLCEVIKRYDENSTERSKVVDHLLRNDITVFLCEAMSNLDWSLFSSILTCLRLLWSNRNFFTDDHDAQTSSAVLRALVHYSSSGQYGAVNCCLQFLCELLTGVRVQELNPPLSCDSAYSIEQLLACLDGIQTKSSINSKATLASALVLQELLSYQNERLRLRGPTATVLASTLERWFLSLLQTLNHFLLIEDDSGIVEASYVIICRMGVDTLRLSKVIKTSTKVNSDFIQTILNDEQEITSLLHSSIAMEKSVNYIILELVNLTKENHKHMSTRGYEVFLKFLYTFLTENKYGEMTIRFSDILFSNGYLSLLPQIQNERQDIVIRKISTLVLGELLNSLSKTYLGSEGDNQANGSFAKDIQMGLVQLHHGIERSQNWGLMLQNCQSYCFIIYLYFYCQSSENPQEVMAPLLPHIVKHILCLPKSFIPQHYMVKSLWLVFAMTTITNSSINSFNDRVILEKAIERFVELLQPNPSQYYTHNPAVLLWTFTSQRISSSVRICVLTKWLEVEDTLPIELVIKPVVWDPLLSILTKTTNETILLNTMKSLKTCLKEMDDESQQHFASLLWSLLPETLAKVMIDSNTETSVRHILELATIHKPMEDNQMDYNKIGSLLTIIFSKSICISEQMNDDVLEYEYVCLKLFLHLLELVNIKKDSRILLTYVNQCGFLTSVLKATKSVDDKVACAALQLLSYIIHYFTKCQYQPKAILEVESREILRSLHKNSSNDRGRALLQFIYLMLNSGVGAPLSLSTYDNLPEFVNQNQQYITLRGLMFRVQMICCKDSKIQPSAGWKTLSSIFKYGISTKNDTKLVSILTTQPWTNILVQFQLGQSIIEEFLMFIKMWLYFHKIIIKQNIEDKKSNNLMVYNQSLMYKTLLLLKTQLPISKGVENRELKDNILCGVQDLLDSDCYDDAFFKLTVN